MKPIEIVSSDGRMLAHHTTESSLSHYGQPVWQIEEDPEPGAELRWIQGEIEHTLTVVGLVDGWLVVRQANDVLSGIIWSDGTYRADLIVDRETEEPAPLDADLRSGRFLVRGTVPFPDSILGAILV